MAIGGEMGGRPLHFIILADCSSSMAGEKIQALNQAIRNTLPEVKDEADKQEKPVQVLIRAVKFNSSAEWHVGTPTPIENFVWNDLSVDGSTNTAAAINMVADALKGISGRVLPPVLMFLTDGQSDDPGSTDAAIKRLSETPWGRKAIRVGIAIGKDADKKEIEKFRAENSEIPLLEANDANTLRKWIRWASLEATRVASQAAPIQPQVSAPDPGAAGGDLTW